MLLGIKRKLKLNNFEITRFRKYSGYSRFVWNYIFDMMQAASDIKASDSAKLETIKKIFTNHVQHREDFYWIKEDNYSSKIYQMEFKYYHTALSDYRKGLKNPPKKKYKEDKRSFSVYDGNGFILPAVEKYTIKDSLGNALNAYSKIKVPTIGTFRLQEHIIDLYPGFELISQTFTVSSEADGWYVSFNVEVDSNKLLDYKQRKMFQKGILLNQIDVAGCDLGVKTFCVTKSKNAKIGLIFQLPATVKELEQAISKFQYRNRNKQLGHRKKEIRQGKNAKKYRSKLGRMHRKLANIRKDFLHKTTSSIGFLARVVRIEDLQVSNMLKNGKLSVAVSRQGFYEFRRQLEYKQKILGFTLMIVDMWYPSTKTCSNCGHKQDMKLSDRTFDCSDCGNSMDRDENAAINLANAPIEKCYTPEQLREKNKKSTKIKTKKSPVVA